MDRIASTFAFCLLSFTLILPAWTAGAFAPVAPELPKQGEAKPSAPLPPPSACAVTGTLFCSEYGSRHLETLMLVLTSGDENYTSSISDTNGSFALPVPCSGSYAMSVAFGDREVAVGTLELPESPSGTAFVLELRHSGSYLELVRDIREGVHGDDITFSLVGQRP